jgi:hypothetical protein
LEWLADCLYRKKNREWILENLNKRLMLKLVLLKRIEKKLSQMGGLKPTTMVKDLVDELLCKFYHWKVLPIKI